jgi:predicted dehydrogenase
VAVVGLGPIGTSHVKALLGLGDAVRLECLVDVNEELRRAKSAEFGVRAVAGIAELPEDINVVSIATPPELHFRLAQVAMGRGFNVFCEKPLTLDVAEAEALAENARKWNLHLGVGFKMRYEPWFGKARELIGEIGPVYQVVTAKFQAFNGKPWVPRTGAMQELSSHDFDLIHWIARVRPVAVEAAHLSYRRGWEKEDGFSLLVKYDNGMLGALSGWYGDSFKWDGRDNAFRFIGARGYLAIDRFERVVLHTDHTEEFRFDTSPNTFELEFKAFLDAVRTGTGDYPDAQAGRDATWIVEAAYRVCPRA